MADGSIHEIAAAHTETHEERSERLEAEYAGLAYDHPDSLRNTLLDVLACGQVTDTESKDISHDRALLRFAASTTRAVALAMRAAQDGTIGCEDSIDYTFSGEDAAYALLGLSALLKGAPELLTVIGIADDRAARESEDAEEAEAAQ